MSDRGELGAVIAATFAAWAQWPSTYEALLDRERSMYGTGDAQEIAHLVDTFCRAHLGSRIGAYLFYASSQGGVSGAVLADGRRIVIKAHGPTWTREVLEALYAVQRALAAGDFPCPRPLLRPTRLGQGYATVEELVDEGGYADGHQPAIRRAMADTLARLVTSTQDLRHTVGLPAGMLTRLPPGALWPAPHSPIFNFDSTTAGADWIDRLAAEARNVVARSASQIVIGHADWSMQNCRFVGDRLRVVYDWDSLARDKETTLVGHAATTFACNWLGPAPAAPPSADEARAFIAAYETARGASFTAAEWEGLAAAATYGLAYGARLEHSLDPRVGGFPTGGGRARLAHYGDGFLRR